MSRTYFFRDEEGYTHRERLDRLHVADFQDPDLPPIRDLIERTPLTAAELQAATQEEVYNKIQRRLNGSWENFVERVFNLRGDKGDLFNLKLYFGSDISYDTLYEKASEKVRDEDHDNLHESKVRNSLVSVKDRGDGILDLRFVIPGNQIAEEDIENDTQYRFYNFYAEVRVYTQQGVLAISRRAMDDDDISRLRNLIETWSEGDIEPQPRLTPNEMLALENALDGQNVGIDYGQFKGGRNIKKARYSGASNLSPLNSEIVRPASLNGRIVKLKFEHTHTAEDHSWDVKIRLQYECKISATKETTPSCINQLVKELVKIREYKSLLRTVTDRLEEHRWKINNQTAAGGIRTYLNRRNLALRTAVDRHVENSQIEAVEIQMFRDLFFSLGCELLKTDQIKDAPDSDIPEDPQQKAHLKQLFDDYSRWDLDDPNYNFDKLWCQLHSLLTSDFTSPVDLIETAKSEFEI
ncbi:hypothetical protein [Halorussus salinisoli]|uniref:hypothetical protein n=1 Tax=Halorussus salinisoli TaxID=2558242 RepID=UPI0010C235D6|nr:hypothetical protein [Halorussus salinisoli]